MTDQTLSMTFGALLSWRLERAELPPKILQSFHVAAPPSPQALHEAPRLSSSHGGKEQPSKPLQITGPSGSGKTEESPLVKMKRDRKFPRLVHLVIYNTSERISPEYMEGALCRVFRESDDTAFVLSHEPRIYEGPYTKDVAKTKVDQMQHDAECRGVPIPHMRLVKMK